MNVWIKKKIIELRKDKKCDCGATENLEFAHVKPTGLNGSGRGRKERYIDIMKHPDCYKLMCRKCHHEYDMLKKTTEKAQQ